MSDVVTSPAGTAAEPMAIDRAVDPIRRAFRWLSVALLFTLIALPALQIILREVLRASFVGIDELAQFVLISVAFITLPYVVSSGANIRLQELLDMFPAVLRRGLHVLIAATGTLAFGIAAASVAVATLRNLDNASPTLGIPYWVFFSAAFVGLAFSAFECAIQFVKALRNRNLYVSFAEEQPPELLAEH